MNKNINEEQSPYDDAKAYDMEYSAVPELSLLSKWIQADSMLPVIEIGCGTGRVTIPLAEKGYRMIGIDSHPAMLAEAEKKAEKKNLSVDWKLSRAEETDRALKAQLIFMAGNTFQHFLTNKEQDELLYSVSSMLKNGGVFIFDTRCPNLEELQETSEKEFWKTIKDSGGSIGDMYTKSRWYGTDQLQHVTQYTYSVDNQLKSTTSLWLRYTFPQELTRLLKQHGLEMIKMYKDWKETPISDNGIQMITVCRKKEKRRQAGF